MPGASPPIENTTCLPSAESAPESAFAVPVTAAGGPPAVGSSTSCCVSPIVSARMVLPSEESDSGVSEREPSEV